MLNKQDIDLLNFNSVENVAGIEARTAFTINSATVFKEDVDIVPTIVDETLSYIIWGGDNLLTKSENFTFSRVSGLEQTQTARGHRKNRVINKTQATMNMACVVVIYRS